MKVKEYIRKMTVIFRFINMGKILGKKELE